MRVIQSISITSYNRVEYISLPEDSEIIKFDFVEFIPKLWYFLGTSVLLQRKAIYIASDVTLIHDNYELEYIGSSKDVQNRMWHTFEVLNLPDSENYPHVAEIKL